MSLVTQSNLLEFVKECALMQHQDFIMSLVKTVIEIDLLRTEPTTGNSKFGGIPDLPLGFKWPKHEFGYYRFLGQINFKDIQTKHDLLPADGVLSLFVADDERLDRYEETSHWARGYYFPPNNKLVQTDHPKKKSQPGTAVSFDYNIDLPFREHLIGTWPLNGEEKERFFGTLVDKLTRATNSVLGYPYYNTLDYNPTPKGDWMLLLNLSSDKKLDWLWGDEDLLMIFIEQEKLKLKDFSDLRIDIG